ncbi:hypothetical protein ABTZ21_00270 [Streptomyces sp. NPDC096191]|uniref:hypothetical protein n=1 Tax=Streptomyces sp. NPDC096191 TaxID=3155426 RepID=UPI00332F60E0
MRNPHRQVRIPPGPREQPLEPRRALGRLDRHPSGTALAAELGYADQAHLVRDFTATVGVPPTAYAAETDPAGPGDADGGMRS